MKNNTLQEVFENLARYTTPHGTEPYCLPFLPSSFVLDTAGNAHILVHHGDGSLPTTMFTSHLDTASWGGMEKVEFVYTLADNGDLLIGTDGTTILGADCKVGVAIMTLMVRRKIPGYYVFFVGEEVGGVGSSHLAEHWDESLCPTVTKCVSLDRYGTCSIITHQAGGRCCSDEFAISLSNALAETEQPVNLWKDEHGTYTDSAEFTRIIPECTNLSVGYKGQHCSSEITNMTYAYDLLESLCSIDWEALEVVRDPNKPERRAGYVIPDDYYLRSYPSLYGKQDDPDYYYNYEYEDDNSSVFVSYCDEELDTMCVCCYVCGCTYEIPESEAATKWTCEYCDSDIVPSIDQCDAPDEADMEDYCDL